MSEDVADASEGEKKGRNWLKILLILFVVFLLICTGVCCGGPFAGGAIMNSGEIDLQEIEDSWVVDDYEKGDEKVKAKPIKDALENQCSPMRNGIRVLFNHLWYNAITDGYDGRVYLVADGNSYDSYTLYIWGYNVFVRDESSKGGYVNRVVTCELDYDDWSKLAEGK